MPNDSLSALSAAISAFNPANGDDAIAVLQALEGSRSEQMAKAADKARDTLVLHTQRLQSLVASRLPARLQVLADTPDAQGKVLCDFSAGQPGQTLVDEIKALGFKLPAATWLQVSSKTYDASGNLVSEQPAYLASAKEVASIRSNDPQTASGSIDQYTHTTGSGANAQTTYIDIHNDEGQVRASNADIAMFDSQFASEVIEVQGDVQMDIARLDGFAKRLFDRMQGDKPLMDQARRDEAVHQAHHQENLQQGPGGATF